MENKKELKIGYKIALIICSILVLVNLVIDVMQLVNGGDITMSIVGVLSMIAALYYAYIGYKKPHGNLLRNAFFVYALLCSEFIVYASGVLERSLTAIIMLEIVLISFMSGRLNKFKQNIAIIVVVGICSLYFAINSLMNTQNLSIIGLFSCFSSFIAWATLSVAYISRYDAHIEAGLEDK